MQLSETFLLRFTFFCVSTLITCVRSDQQLYEDIKSSRIWEHEPLQFIKQPKLEPVPFDDILQLLFASNFPTAVATNISSQCIEDSQLYVEALSNRTQWALMMYESTGQFPEGYVGGGNVHAVGLFDECLSIRAVPDVQSSSTLFTGQYCTVYFHVEPVSADEIHSLNDPNQRAENWLLLYQIYQQLFNESLPLKTPKIRETDPNTPFLPSVGLCLPSSCSAEDVRSACAQQVGSSTIRRNQSVVTITDANYCYTKEQVDAPPDLDGADITVIVIFSCLGLVIIVATLYDGWRLHYEKRPIQSQSERFSVRMLHCFSALSNAKAVLNTSTNNPDNLACLNGIRVITTTWVMMGHIWRWHISRSNLLYNRNQLYEDLYQEWTMQAITSFSVSVDTFFVMSGLLVAYSLFRELDRNDGRMNLVFFYLHRYLRLTVVYALILGFVATLLSHLGTGPEWRRAETLSQVCRTDWWQNLLYINNYFLADSDIPNNICMGESWYLAADMQMFWLSPLFIYPLWRWRRVGLGWIVFSISILISASISIYIVWNLPPNFNLPYASERNVRYDTNYYQETWVHFPPYLVGILLGSLLHRTKNSKIELTKIQVLLGWGGAVLIGLAVVYGLVPYMGDEVVPDVPRVIYGSLNRLFWAIAVSWVIFACVRGYGGYIDNLLSWKAFTVLGRLTYIVYLVHYNFLAVYYAHVRKPYYYTVLDRVVFFLGVVFLIFLIAFLVSVTVEVPFLNLEKILIVKPNQKRPVANPSSSKAN